MITLGFVIIIGLISYRAFEDRSLFEKLKHHPHREQQDKSYYRWFTAGLIHGDWLHLGLNLFVLYSFGDAVEHYYLLTFGAIKGRIFYVLLFLLSIIGANYATYLRHKDNPSFSSVGASGGVSGVLFASIVFAPWSKIYLYGIIGIPGIVAGVAYIAYSYYRSQNQRDNIDHEAHLHGAIIGFCFTIALSPMTIFPYFISQLTNF